MNDDDDALDPRAMDLLAACRADEALPADVEARVWTRLEASSATRTRAAWKTWAAVGLVAMAAAAIATVAVRSQPLEERASDPGSQAADAPQQLEAESASTVRPPPPAPGRSGGVPTPPEPSHAIAPSPAAPATAAPAPSPSRPHRSGKSPGPLPAPAPAPAPPPSSAPSSSSAPAPAPSPSSAPGETTSSLAEETRLLERAQAALKRGEPQTAIEILRASERKFPRGVLQEERAALGVIALCETEQTDAGRRAAAAFVRRHPGSGLTSRVRNACKTTPSGDTPPSPAPGL